MRIDRRRFLTTIAGVVLVSAGVAFAPVRALALGQDEAKTFVQGTVDAVIEIADAPVDPKQKAERVQGVMQDRAAIPQIARFAAGRIWRDMDEGQQERYVDAFLHYISHIYAGRFQEYSGQQLELGNVSESDRGLTVASRIVGGGQAPIAVDWLVTDRPGRTVIADITIEGVSMLITQREEIAGIYARNGNDPEKLIDFLGSVGVEAQQL